MQKRFFRKGIFLIEEKWEATDTRTNGALSNQHSKNGKYTVTIGIGLKGVNRFKVIISSGEGYTLTSAKTKAFENYKKSVFGKNSLLLYKRELKDYINETP